MKRYLGIDYGAKRIGLAVGDSQIKLASPVEVIEEGGPERQLDALIRIAKDYSIDEFVLGLPLNMDGTEGEQAVLTRSFGQRLSGVWTGKLHFHDERLSSYTADELMGDRGGKRGKKKRRPIDSIAAQVMLQGFLDALD